MPDSELRRLLEAARAAEEAEPAMPYGFDTRVLALARTRRLARGNDTWELARLVRRIAFSAVVVTACAGAAAYWQMSENDDLGEPLTNAYAIADNAIDLELYP